MIRRVETENSVETRNQKSSPSRHYKAIQISRYLEKDIRISTALEIRVLG
jgi:hypothetical protein